MALHHDFGKICFGTWDLCSQASCCACRMVPKAVRWRMCRSKNLLTWPITRTIFGETWHSRVGHYWDAHFIKAGGEWTCKKRASLVTCLYIAPSAMAKLSCDPVPRFL